MSRDLRSGDYARTWADFRAKTAEPHFAEAGTILKSKDVDSSLVGHHVSLSTAPGIRVYMFSGQANRDRFVNRYRAWGAKPCGDPFP